MIACVSPDVHFPRIEILTIQFASLMGSGFYVLSISAYGSQASAGQ